MAKKFCSTKSQEFSSILTTTTDNYIVSGRGNNNYKHTQAINQILAGFNCSMVVITRDENVIDLNNITYYYLPQKMLSGEHIVLVMEVRISCNN